MEVQSSSVYPLYITYELELSDFAWILISETFIQKAAPVKYASGLVVKLYMDEVGAYRDSHRCVVRLVVDPRLIRSRSSDP